MIRQRPASRVAMRSSRRPSWVQTRRLRAALDAEGDRIADAKRQISSTSKWAGRPATSRRQSGRALMRELVKNKNETKDFYYLFLKKNSCRRLIEATSRRSSAVTRRCGSAGRCSRNAAGDGTSPAKAPASSSSRSMAAPAASYPRARRLGRDPRGARCHTIPPRRQRPILRLMRSARRARASGADAVISAAAHRASPGCTARSAAA